MKARLCGRGASGSDGSIGACACKALNPQENTRRSSKAGTARNINIFLDLEPLSGLESQETDQVAPLTTTEARTVDRCHLEAQAISCTRNSWSSCPSSPLPFFPPAWARDNVRDEDAGRRAS